jgi:hypothetical protein
MSLLRPDYVDELYKETNIEQQYTREIKNIEREIET